MNKIDQKLPHTSNIRNKYSQKTTLVQSVENKLQKIQKQNYICFGINC